MGRKLISPEIEEAMILDYLAGMSSTQIGKKYNFSQTIVSRKIKKNGIQARPRTKLTKEQVKEICELYLLGFSTTEIAKEYNVNAVTIWNNLKENDIKTRTPKEALAALTDEEERTALDLYRDGKSLKEVGFLLNANPITIRNILLRNNVKPRKIWEACDGLSPEQKEDIISRYLYGETGIYIAETYNVCPAAIYQILKRQNIKARPQAGCTDNMKDALACTNRFSEFKSCSFYLYELHSYSNEYCKPGIAYNVDLRALAGYGNKVCVLEFSNRHEAYFYEQAFLSKTIDSQSCPDEYLGWAGYTEIRNRPAKKFLPVVDNLYNEFNDSNVWEFVLKHCILTEKQKKICEVRRDIDAPIDVALQTA